MTSHSFSSFDLSTLRAPLQLKERLKSYLPICQKKTFSALKKAEFTEIQHWYPFKKFAFFSAFPHFQLIMVGVLMVRIAIYFLFFGTMSPISQLLCYEENNLSC